MNENISQEPLAVANYFIKKSGYRATPLQLIKLSYIAHGYVLAMTNNHLFNEQVEAWKFGPVIPSVYHSFKHYGKSRVDKLSFDMTFNDDFSYVERDYIFRDDTDAEVYQVLDAVWAGYGKYSGFELVDLTHQKNTPWDKTYNADPRTLFIDNENIKDYYAKIIC